MNPDLPLERSPDTHEPSTDLSQVFAHPQGLETARAIAKSLIIQAQRLALTDQPTHPQTFPSSSNAASDSRSTPSMDPSSAGMLNSLLALGGSHSQTSSGEGLPHPIPQGPGDHQDQEMPDRSHVELSSTTAAPQSGPHTDPFSNAGGNHMNIDLPHNGPYLPTHLQQHPNDHSQIHPPSHASTSNSLASFTPPQQPNAVQFVPSNNNIWVSHEFSTPTPPNHSQSSTTHPPSGVFEMRHSTFSSAAPSQSTMEPKPGKSASKKRKLVSGEEKKPKAQKLSKPKEEMKESVFDDSIYMRILEFTPPSFLAKARLISKPFKDYVDSFTSIYVNLRKENFGSDMPAPPEGISEQQYNDLLGGKKGCLNQGCNDKKAIRTHWSWYKRWCWDCWKSKIEREDRVMKSRGSLFGRANLTKMLECIPVGMHDSFLKPHDYVENPDARPRGAPRLYKYYLTEDIEQIIKEFDALTPAPYVENPEHSAAERAAALAAHQELTDGLEAKRAAFFAERKAKNDEHMTQVKKIEAGIRGRRARNRNPYDENRNARKELFSRRAKEDLSHIDINFVERTVAYKAATRIFRDAGTERGWLTLKPKIIAEWEAFKSGKDIIEETDRMDTERTDGNVVDRAVSGHSFLPHMMGTNDGHCNNDPYERLQQYQSQLQRLEDNKQSRRPFPPHGPSSSTEGNYMHGAHSSQSLYPPVGGGSTFPSSAFSIPTSDSRSSSGGQHSQSLTPGHPQSPPHYFPPSFMGTSPGYPQGSLHNPSTQITVNSLLGPSTPTVRPAKSAPLFGHYT